MKHLCNASKSSIASDKAPAAGKQQIKKSTNEKSMIALVAIGLSFSAKAQSSDSISTDKNNFFCLCRSILQL